MATGTVTIEGRADLAAISRSIAGMQRQFGELQRDTGRVRKEVTGLGIALGAELANRASEGARALGELVHQTLTARLEVAALAKSTGVSAETFGALQVAADRAGFSSDAVAGALKALGTAAYAASTQNAAAVAKFEDLEVSIYDTNGALKDNETLFREVIGKLGEVEGEATRAGKAQDIFGSSADALTGALGQLSADGLARAEQSAAAFTSRLTKDGIAAAKRYEVAINQLAVVKQTFADKVSDVATPAVSGFAVGLTYVSTFAAELFNKAFERLGERLFFFLSAVKEAGPVILKVFTGDFVGARAALESGGKKLEQVRDTLKLSLNPLNDFGDALNSAKQKADAVTAAMVRQSENLESNTEAVKKNNKQRRQQVAITDEMIDAQIQFGNATAQLAPLQSEVAAGAFGYAIALQAVGQTATDFREAIALSADNLGKLREETELTEEQLAKLAQQEAFARFAETAGQVSMITNAVADLAGMFSFAGKSADEMTERQRRAAMVAFRVQQSAAIATAVIQTAAGVAQALGGAPPPVNFINAALVGAAGAVQIAKIASQKPSFALGGVMPSTGGNAILHPGEGVLSAGAVDSMGGATALAAANSRTALGQPAPVVVQWRHLRRSFDLEMRDASRRTGSTRDVRRDGRRAGQVRGTVRAHYGDL